MYMNRSISRVLAAAVASAGFVAPMPVMGATLSCTSASFSATSDGAGNINVSCTPAGGGSTPSCTVSASPTFVAAAGGTVTLTASNCGSISSWAGGKSTTGGTSTSWQDTLPANTSSSNVTYRYAVSGD